MTNVRQADTLEELTHMLITGSDWIQKLRFTLESSVRVEYDSPIDGEIWRQGLDRAIEEAGGYENHWSARQDFVKRYPEPQTHLVTTWYLLNDRDFRINLSSGLGIALDEVWTKSPRWQGEEPTINRVALSLKGMLERLGVEGLTERINEARIVREAISRKAQRSDRLKRVNKLLLEVVEVFSLMDEVEFVNSGMTVVELLEKTANH